MLVEQWAEQWNIPRQAVEDLRARIGVVTQASVAIEDNTGEAGVQAFTRLSASRRGGILWRNNVGVCYHPGTQQPVRYGLANDSKKMNENVKSSDLIGITPVLITPDMFGQTIGVFTARECKRPGWMWSGTKREKAQKNFLNIVNGMGGDGRFVCSTTGHTKYSR